MALRGELSDFGVSELLQILSMGKKSGILELCGGESPGSLTLLDGRLVDAGSGESVGERAVFLLLENRGGRFTFTPASIEELGTREVTVQRNLDSLLLEASQRLP
jgi:hypothetical protein